MPNTESFRRRPGPRPSRFRSRTSHFATYALLPLSAQLFGCDQLAEKESEPRTSAAVSTADEPKPTAPSTEKGKISDKDIEGAIRHRLYIEGVFPSTLIDVKVKEGIVHLSGSAFSLFAKNQAQEIISSTRGVRGYIDKTEVVRIDIEDAELERKVEQALLLDPATEAYEIETSVEGGVVRLTGKVESWAELDLAGEVAASVMGVTQVKNELTMEAPPVRPDHEIKAEIEKSLVNDVLVDSALVAIDVDAGVVTLGGVVGSAAERQRAVDRSWISGVSRVNAEDLKVQWWNRDRFTSQSPPTLRPDVEVKSAILDALAQDARVNHDDIEVFVDSGRVTLTGEVPSLRSKNTARETAQNTLGVTRVRNYLQVNPDDDADDEELRKRIERAIILNPYLTTWDGTITTKNGIVHLEGVVNTAQQKRRVESVVSRVIGVRHVENLIDVYLQEMEDGILKSDVEEALRWNVFVAPSDVVVTAEGGKITLTGQVDSVRAFRQAADAARDAGAEVVYNRLQIEEPG